jgi:formate hydrogenlyase subunit 3/multisubunit Na+/H+ antiporter MnhD subunit
MNNHPRPAYFLNLNLPQFGTWKKADYFSALVLTLVGVVSTILGGLSFGNKETAKDSKRFPISQFLLFFSMLLSLVSLM